ncbi:hypothetical protein M3M38_02160 [Fructilactobacillus cliffordii]|uniref:hypothetical protein n=1 Tax=Fructilactobacillus cliffordii TaxID=2940299 RepID=UPI002092DABF|nr:hypothetical protein [Fructilactobacillus cliffordii]USS86888.1 hypothetical protein M3M38_02160 [Fructilactobacillus cliffordii]
MNSEKVLNAIRAVAPAERPTSNSRIKPIRQLTGLSFNEFWQVVLDLEDINLISLEIVDNEIKNILIHESVE